MAAPKRIARRVVLRARPQTFVRSGDKLATPAHSGTLRVAIRNFEASGFRSPGRASVSLGFKRFFHALKLERTAFAERDKRVRARARTRAHEFYPIENNIIVCASRAAHFVRKSLSRSNKRHRKRKTDIHVFAVPRENTKTRLFPAR